METSVSTCLYAAKSETVPGEGLEPSPFCKERILSPQRLPFRHPGLEGVFSGAKVKLSQRDLGGVEAEIPRLREKCSA